jgi:hypothetical protein
MDSYRYGYQGSEKDDESKGGGNSYTTYFRQLDPRVVRWFSVDPKMRAWESPYVSMGNSPTYRTDVLGDTDSPIFDENGEMLGTDDQGVKGKAIIMDKKDFTQGMSHKEATEKNLGFGKLKSKDAQKKVISFLTTAPLRPDYDGELSLDEVEDWYTSKTGTPLFVDASKLDLSPVEKKDLKVNEPKLINYALEGNTTVGSVYGRIYLTLLDKMGNVKVGLKNGKIDTYDFDINEYDENGSYSDHAKTFARNTLTRVGKLKAGDGKGFDIYSYKLGKVK